MNDDDPIGQLLRDADADVRAGGSSKPAAEPWALARRVRSVTRRRRLVRRAVAVTATCAVAIAATVVLRTSTDEPAPSLVAITTPAAPDARAQLVALRAEADREAGVAARLIASERRLEHAALVRRTAAAPDPAQRSRQQVERAALSVVYEADRLAASGEPAAGQLYAAAVANFPDTRAAAIARQRLGGETERKDGSG